MIGSGGGNTGPPRRRLTVVFVARLLRVVAHDDDTGAIINPQRILFRVFREADLHALRTLVYGNYQPPPSMLTTFSVIPALIHTFQVPNETRSMQVGTARYLLVGALTPRIGR